MKDGLTPSELRLVEEFIEPYRDTIEDVLTCNDYYTDAEKSAWTDWAVLELQEKLGLTEGQAVDWIKKLEVFYNLNN